jgi:hypothetical protein
MFFGLFGLRMLPYAALGLAIWFAYGWGSQIIQNYSDMAMQIERLERDKKLIDSRVESYKTLLARRDAAIAASTCKAKIEYLIKNPDKIPSTKSPFPTDGGG